MAKRPRKNARPDAAAQQIADLLSKGQARVEQTISAPPSMRRHFSPDEFIDWAEATLYRDIKGMGWGPLVWLDWQHDAIGHLLAINEAGQLVHSTIMPCWVRRAGKTEFTAAYDLKRADTYDDQVIKIQGNSADQGEDTVFKQIVDFLSNSPAFKARLSPADIEILSGEITFHRTGSTIAVQPAKEGSTYGQKLSTYHNTELCKASDDKLYQVGASSTGDAWCGLAIIDSNMGDASNPVARYVELAEQAEEEARRANREQRIANPAIGDPQIAASYIHFANLADVLKRGCGEGLEAGLKPIHPWLSPVWIRSRFAQMTIGEFLRNHCNIPSGTGAEVWTAEQIDPLFRADLPPYACTRAGLAAVTELLQGNGTWTIGVGLDRALATAKAPDRSVLPVVGKTVIPLQVGRVTPIVNEFGTQIGEEVSDGSVYVYLGAWEYMHSLRDPIEAKLRQVDAAIGISAFTAETYQASDLVEWCKGQRFGDGVDLRAMTKPGKHQMVQNLHSLIVQRRFFASTFYAVLRAEMSHYAEDASGGGIPSYAGKREKRDLVLYDQITSQSRGKATTWIKDDYVESLMWALEAADRGKPTRIRQLPRDLKLPGCL